MQPVVYRVTHQRLALSGIRLGLAALGFVRSIVAGADAAAAGVGLALGAGICGLALVTDRRWLLLGKPTAEPLPESAGRAPLTRAVASGLLPSTVGVAVLVAASLVFQPILAAVLAGILAGMGIVGLVSWLEVMLWSDRRTCTSSPTSQSTPAATSPRSRSPTTSRDPLQQTVASSSRPSRR